MVPEDSSPRPALNGRGWYVSLIIEKDSANGRSATACTGLSQPVRIEFPKCLCRNRGIAALGGGETRHGNGDIGEERAVRAAVA